MRSRTDFPARLPGISQSSGDGSFSKAIFFLRLKTPTFASASALPELIEVGPDAAAKILVARKRNMPRRSHREPRRLPG